MRILDTALVRPFPVHKFDAFLCGAFDDPPRQSTVRLRGSAYGPGVWGPRESRKSI